MKGTRQKIPAVKKEKKDFAPFDSPAEKIFYEVAKKLGIELKFQVPFSGYFIDFVYQEGDTKIAIEIDGSRYHSSKQQITQDYKRQRFLQRSGFYVIRFTGKEIFQETEECVRELILMKKMVCS